MVQRCNNLCERFRSSRNPRAGPIEGQGLAYCRLCEEHLPSEVLLPKNFCPCCKAKVRIRTRYGTREPNWAFMFDWLFYGKRTDLAERVERWKWSQVRSRHPFVGDSA